MSELWLLIDVHISADPKSEYKEAHRTTLVMYSEIIFSVSGLCRSTVLLNTKGQFMKESSILERNAVDNFLLKEVLLNTKGQSMKKSNIHAGNAANNLLVRDNLLNIKGQYMGASSILQTMQPTIYSEWMSCWTLKDIPCTSQISLQALRQTIYSERTSCWTSKGSSRRSKISLRAMQPTIY